MKLAQFKKDCLDNFLWIRMYSSIGFIAEQISQMFMKRYQGRMCEMNYNDKRPIEAWKIPFPWFWYVFKEMTVWVRSILEKSHLRHACLVITATKWYNPVLDMGDRTKPKKARMNTRAKVFSIFLGSFEKLSTRKDNGNLPIFDLINFSILEILRLRNLAKRLIGLSSTGGFTTLGLELIQIAVWYSFNVGTHSCSPRWNMAVETSQKCAKTWTKLTWCSTCISSRRYSSLSWT